MLIRKLAVVCFTGGSLRFTLTCGTLALAMGARAIGQEPVRPPSQPQAETMQAPIEAVQPVAMNMSAGAVGEVTLDAPDVSPQQQSTGSISQGTPPPQEGDEGQQSKRILFIIPNFRAASVDAKLPPLDVKGKFKLALADSFDYSAFIYVGLQAGASMAEDSYPVFHQGAAGYGRYYWHTFADNALGNTMTEFIVPAATHEDPRYYTLGRGGLIKRTGYSIGRLLITRKDQGGETFNFSEIVGNGAAAGISTLYYPSQYRTWTKTGQKWIYQIGIDGGSNVVKEFWPDFSHAVMHHHKDAS